MEWILIIFLMTFSTDAGGLGDIGYGEIVLLRVPALAAPFNSRAACETVRDEVIDNSNIRFYTKEVFVRCVPKGT